MPIFLSQTYQIVSEESAEHGDFEDTGFDWEDVPHTFKEVVDLIKDCGFIHKSDSHGVPRWLSTEDDIDFQTGDRESKSLHPASDSRSQRYWAKACKAAGIIK